MPHLESFLSAIKPLLGLIRFVDVPRGGAPLEIRRQWIAVEVPCLYKGRESGVNVVTREPESYMAYTMFQEQALRALREKSPAAAHYWNHIGYPTGDMDMFIFNVESAIEIKPVLERDEYYRKLGI